MTIKINDEIETQLDYGLGPEEDPNTEVITEGTKVKVINILKNPETGQIREYVVQYGSKTFCIHDYEWEDKNGSQQPSIV